MYALISFVVMAQLICAFVFAYAKIRFSDEALFLPDVMATEMYAIYIQHKSNLTSSADAIDQVM